jgi:hypothetical protein
VGEYHRSMRRHLLSSLVVATAALTGAALLGCGSQTKTVSATNAPSPAQTTASTTTTTQATSPASTTATTQAQTTTGSGGAAPTRTAPEPAFTQQETHAEGASAAAAVVRARGYTPNDTSEYHPAQTLRVMIATRSGSGDGYGQQAFFFVGGRYIGTDAKEPSAKVKVLSQSDTEVTLAYPLYRSGDPLSSPSGGQATVQFQLNNGKLAPLGHIPPASRGAGLSRY